MNKEIIGKMLVDNARKAMLENVDKIDDVKFLQNELKEHLRKEFDLQQQFEEKNKVIDEILNFQSFTDDCPCIEIYDYIKILNLCNCSFCKCKDDYKKCWIKYFENETLERGKNANTTN